MLSTSIILGNISAFGLHPLGLCNAVPKWHVMKKVKCRVTIMSRNQVMKHASALKLRLSHCELFLFEQIILKYLFLFFFLLVCFF